MRGSSRILPLHCTYVRVEGGIHSLTFECLIFKGDVLACHLHFGLYSKLCLIYASKEDFLPYVHPQHVGKYVPFAGECMDAHMGILICWSKENTSWQTITHTEV